MVDSARRPEEPGPDLLAAIEGSLRLSDSITLTVVRDATRLLVTFSGQSPMGFVAVSATTFAALAADTLLRVDGPAPVSELTFGQNDTEIACPRIP